MSAPSFTITEYSRYVPGSGYLGAIANNQIDWHSCREHFHSMCRSNKNIKYRYYLISSHPDNTMDLVGYVEDRLGIKNKTRFHRQENYKGWKALQIQPSPFWTSQHMRHQFLTCCLKASVFRSHGWDHLKTMRSYNYLGTTWDAVQRFLHGDNWCIGRMTGWHNQFHNAKPEHYLVRPDQNAVNTRAYELWEESGRPQGADFSQKAREEIFA